MLKIGVAVIGSILYDGGCNMSNNPPSIIFCPINIFLSLICHVEFSLLRGYN
jgi:hypothetical protein